MLNYGYQKRVSGFGVEMGVIAHILFSIKSLIMILNMNLLLVNYRPSFSVFNTAIEAGYAYDKYVIENSLEHIANGIGQLPSFLKDNQ